MDDVNYTFQLDECLDWITERNFKRVVVQLQREDLKKSPEISAYLQDKFHERISGQQPGDKEPRKLDVYVTQTNTCCVDLLVTQHISDVDAIIHMGRVCFSKPMLKNQQVAHPILFVPTHPRGSASQFNASFKLIEEEILKLENSHPNCQMCVLYDTDLIDYAVKLRQTLDSIEVAKIRCPDPNWCTTPANSSMLLPESESVNNFGHFALQKPICEYNCAIYLGERLSLNLTLNGPSKMIQIKCKESIESEIVNVSRILNRRVALVDRLKDQDELKIGVIITNPLPDMNEAIRRLKQYSEPRRHTLYFITMIQTIDECKIGNFDLCDAFIVINSCTCSTILESLVFNRPILNELEFRMACGFETEYGRVVWPGSDSHLSVDDMINKRKVSDVSVALTHTRKELLERCSQARLNKWSGMEFKASSGDSQGAGTRSGESVAIEEGLTGIASSYVSEPLKKEQP